MGGCSDVACPGDLSLATKCAERAECAESALAPGFLLDPCGSEFCMDCGMYAGDDDWDYDDDYDEPKHGANNYRHITGATAISLEFADNRHRCLAKYQTGSAPVGVLVLGVTVGRSVSSERGYGTLGNQILGPCVPGNHILGARVECVRLGEWLGQSDGASVGLCERACVNGEVSSCPNACFYFVAAGFREGRGKLRA